MNQSERADDLSFDVASFLADGAIFEREDGRFTVGWGQPDRAAAMDHDRLSVYAPDFMLTEPDPWLIFPSSRIAARQELLERLGSQDEPSVTGHVREWVQPNFADFEARFDRIQSAIAEGRLIKAVPVVSRTSAQPIDPSTAADLLARALRHTAGSRLRAFGVWTGAEGILGMTPERLFTLRGRRALETMALAGTRSNQPGTPSLLDDSKEVHEHQIVVDGILDRLREFGMADVGATKELELPSITHLFTPIAISLDREIAFEEAASALHPTPALGAWPTEAGRAWLKSDPGSLARRRHGAPFAVIEPSAETKECLAAIRCLQWNEAGSQLTAGCGIVKGSVLDREWIEIASKLDAVQLTLGL